MIYGVILASGVGSRMKEKIPKQFIKIDGIPIIAYTVYSLCNVKRIDLIIIVCHPDYIEDAREIVDVFFSEEDKARIVLITGGKERIDSIDNAISYIVKTTEIGEEDIIIFHDAVRPFVTREILENSIDGAREKGATVAGLAAVDTMLVSEDGNLVDDIPDRSKLFNGQAPDSFRLKLFLQMRSNIDDERRKEVFGTSKICELNNAPIYMIPGDELNFKITTPNDLKKAKFYLSLIKEEDHESFKFARNK